MDDDKTPGDWIRRFARRPGDGPVLLCLPHAGGSAGFFMPVARLAGEWAEVLSAQYPGRQDRRLEPCVDRVTDMADRIAAEVRPWTRRPLILFGHSMGAVVAYEVARRLERSGVVPAGLFVSGRTAPSFVRDRGLHRKPDADLLAEVRALGGTASVLLQDEEFMRGALPAIRADYRAIETYRHTDGPALGCPVIALTGEDDPRAPVADVAAWRAHTTGAFRLHTFPGGHFYLTDHLPRIASLIRDHATTTVPSP
ncbi:thioesterase II family protein [Nonomuraea fuscirosea]|uniref:thioesterase II family protein n=1 Tax=Nonomuraea fuscirosea TaxID=1291556 RepID=UPI003416FAB9